eukprot:TRINITY_DN6610_c0_g1_i2.p1 TRINITY_DN6610_c0_g1~~TRINITY_DN6610_c0_g1_i2.p1  ORF type:complete len:258 (+),score=3.33 TRINITY_DN6610_c0_g1_i2:70-774(+)
MAQVAQRCSRCYSSLTQAESAYDTNLCNSCYDRHKFYHCKQCNTALTNVELSYKTRYCNRCYDQKKARARAAPHPVCILCNNPLTVAELAWRTGSCNACYDRARNQPPPRLEHESPDCPLCFMPFEWLGGSNATGSFVQCVPCGLHVNFTEIGSVVASCLWCNAHTNDHYRCTASDCPGPHCSVCKQPTRVRDFGIPGVCGPCSQPKPKTKFTVGSFRGDPEDLRNNGSSSKRL